MPKTLAAVVAACCALAGTARAAEVFVTVSTTNASYSPSLVFIEPGDTVTWTYAGGPMGHQVRADDGSYMNPVSSSPWTFSHTFSVTGTSRYYCGPHGGPGGVGMSGRVVVGGRITWAPTDIPYTLNAWDFSPRDSSMATGSTPVPAFHRNGAGADLIAGVRLPSGAHITGMEVSGCDDGIDAINANLMECLDPDGTCALLAAVNTTGTPGCGFFGVTVSGTHADNLARSYVARVVLGSTQTLRSLRVFYRKEVSPPPATPTFSDVPPSDPRYRFVEALAKAGITGGCGGGQYCPEAALTRGQMAVFLAVALGLYWPN